AGDRRAQSRNAYYPGQELFAFKKFRWWWNNAHRAVYDADDGLGAIPRGNVTAWAAQSKSIMFMEYGFASIDRDTNRENVFFNPGTVAGGAPFWCEWQGIDGAALAPKQDALIQFAGHQAWYQYWIAGGNNVMSRSGVQMIATDMMFAWNWDARPFPTFPLRLDIWSDGVNWRSGMWLAGKGPALPSPASDTAPGPGSYDAFPSLSGEGWSVKYSPRFVTRSLAHVSGRETRSARMSTPLYDVELLFDVLRDAPAFGELQEVIGFIAAHAGQATPFLLPPPGAFATISGAALGVGDGMRRVFILHRFVAGFSEAAQALIGSPTVYQDGVALSSSAYAVSILPATITFDTAPAAGAALTADFSPAHLARFTNDAEELEQFMSGFW
ncbi:MAG: glycoside hydrolase TIM-barrel-like domain-containing protein, partial [Alphaproteobacteria bacterium]|nr:glycoside hydrolase TIM-barrel-like domain-containing protein [Alphaproteobacteria bacterium]